MEYARKERIGNPDLFTGRKKELAFFLKWINDIKTEKSMSTAILARRKMGKTAIIERLFNITFNNNDRVIPFYFEVQDKKMYIVDFCVQFLLTFVYQYLAFKTRKIQYLHMIENFNLKKAKQTIQSEGLDYLLDLITGVETAILAVQLDTLWEIVRQAPKKIAESQDEFVVQMIDEFQFLNARIYSDKDKSDHCLIDDLAGGYLSTAESKVAPLLVSGSWVGWLMKELNTMLPARFRYTFLDNMPEDEALEMVFNYSGFFAVPVTEETAYMIAKMTEGSPFYISSMIRSNCPKKDLTSIHGLTHTLEFETFNDGGLIKSTWMDYVLSAFGQVNEKNAKNIVLYLCQHRDREVSRQELLENLALDMTDMDLEKKMKALVKADIVSQGISNVDYRGVQDNIFDKVFRGVYEKEIRDFDVATIKKEYFKAFEKFGKEYYQLLGITNHQKGYFAEFLLVHVLQYRAQKKNELLKSVTQYLPADFNFCHYARVWRYDYAQEYARNVNVDIFARAQSPEHYSMICEVKNRDVKKFSKEEAMAFLAKHIEVKKRENLERVVPFVFSRCGFTKGAADYCQQMGIACSDNKIWLES